MLLPSPPTLHRCLSSTPQGTGAVAFDQFSRIAVAAAAGAEASGAGAAGAAGASPSGPLESLLSADSLAFEAAGGLDLPGAPGGPPAPVFNRSGGDRRVTGAPAAALHAALRVVLGRRGGAQRDALYAPLLAAMTPRREQRG